jgi:hypothetical protein
MTVLAAGVVGSQLEFGHIVDEVHETFSALEV